MRVLFAVGLLMAMASPIASAQGDFIQDQAGRPEVRDDGARCFVAAEEGEACLVLYALIMYAIDPARMGVQGPPTACRDIGEGFVIPTAGPASDQAQMDLHLAVSFNHYPQEDGGPCEPWSHPHWGPYGGLRFAPDRPLYLHWFLSADADEARLVADPPLDVGAMPCVTVRARLYAALDRSNLTLLSEGASSRTVLSTNSTRQELLREDPCATGLAAEDHPNLEIAPAHEFAVLLPPPERDLAPGERMLVRVDWFQTDEPAKTAQREWNLRSGPELRPRLVVPIVEPLSISRMEVERSHQGFLVNTSLSSPVGLMDIDPGSLSLTIRGPEGPVPFHAGEPVIRFAWLDDPLTTEYVDAWHDYAGEPANFTFSFQLPRGTPPGEYSVRLSVTNWQHTANATAETTFVIGSDSRSSPSLAIGFALGALAVWMAAFRRR